MRVTVAAIGRDRVGPSRALFEAYGKRCPWPIRLVEIAPRAGSPSERRLAEEAERLLKALPPDAVTIALDEHGRDLDSAEFARRIGAWQTEGRNELGFLIGGPDGLAPSVLERADAILAFGRMTWPHRLVRVLLAEQLYRASAILAGHPYHRE
jgi:23S rRNA (pseudouridine1915-N3)-methyltransferase